MKYRFAGKEKRLALGMYPEVTLASVRAKRDKARGQWKSAHPVAAGGVSRIALAANEN
ncbi:MAG: Arm DNA-binding domain-containing protein [Burkholderiales bacterium]